MSTISNRKKNTDQDDEDADVPSRDKRSNLETNGIVNEFTNPLCDPATNEKKTFKHAALPKWEFAFCVAISIGFLGYVKYRASVISKGKQNINEY